MPEPETDQIAREAARLIAGGELDDIGQAVRIAAGTLRLHGVPPPSWQRVRKHLQAMTMQSVGEEGYQERVRSMWETAEQLMTLLSSAFDDALVLLTGRAVKGQIDGGLSPHLRIYTRASVGEIAQVLVEHGCEEPSFETVNTRRGRLNRLRLVDEGWEIVITRRLPEMAGRPGTDLVTGKPIATATIEQLRRLLGE